MMGLRRVIKSHKFVRNTILLGLLSMLLCSFVLYGNTQNINSVILDKRNKSDTCWLMNPFTHRLLMIDNGSTMITKDTIDNVLTLQLNSVFQVTGIILNLGPSCSDCIYTNIEVRVGYNSSNTKNNAICHYSRINRKHENKTLHIVCYRCPLYGNIVNIRISGYYSGFEMNVVDIYGYNAPERCAAKPQCRKNIDADVWHQWINKDIDVNHAFESLTSKYLYPWLSLAARKMHGLSDKGRVQSLKLYEEYPMISPLDIASAFGQITYRYTCRLRWNQRYLDATGVWQLKPIFNGSHVEVINSSHLLNSRTCRVALKQFRFIVDNSPRQSLPEYMDVIYQFSDYPNTPLSNLAHSDEPNNHRSQAASLLPNWLTSKGGFSGGIDYYTVNYTIPLLNIPPPILVPCTTDQNIDIPWIYVDKWIDQPVDLFLKFLSVKKTQVEDCSSVCDTSSEWHTRRPQAAWQGSISAAYPNIKLAGNWRHHQRTILKEQGIQHPDILDIQLLHCAACSDETRHAMVDALGAFVETDRMHIHGLDNDTYLCYQGLIDIDGATWSSRLYQLLTRGAVVFKQHSQYKEWWSDLLIPGTHYVSLSYDMLDTASIVQSTLADEERCQLIALNGVQFAATYLRLESWLKYSQIFLRAYSALLIKPWQKLSHMDIHYLFKHGDRIRQEHKKFS